MQYVIIGNSAAAAGTIEGIRSVDRTGDITVISSEAHHIYSRPLISYLLEGKTDENRMKYRPDSFYRDNGAKLLAGVSAVKIDPDKKTVQLSDGETVGYDRLMLATGSRPMNIPFEGLDTVSSRHSFMTLDDVLGLRAALTPDSRVLIIGAGLIGLKCAEGIRGLCGEITVVDLADRVLSSVLDGEAGEIVQSHMEEKGVRFILGHSVKKFSGNRAVLDNGEEMDFDVLVCAVGVRPNTELLAEAGGKVERGIITDSHQRTSLSDIYAAGDCTVSHDISKDADRILAIMPNAYLQGEAAGKSMAGDEAASYDCAIPMNAGGFFGLHIITAGSYDGEVYVSRKGKNLKKLFYRDNLLRGYIMTGDVARAGIYTSLIKNKTPLSEIDFPLICEEPCLMAFKRDYRDEKLGGKTNEN